MRADHAEIERERGDMRTENHPQRHVARRKPPRQKLDIPAVSPLKMPHRVRHARIRRSKGKRTGARHSTQDASCTVLRAPQERRR